jgi:hypothetical protein
MSSRANRPPTNIREWVTLQDAFTPLFKMKYSNIKRLTDPAAIKGEVGEIKNLVSELDLVYAIAYVHYVHKRNVVPGKSFKTWLAEEREYGPAKLPDKFPLEPINYPQRIRELGFYLLCRHEESKPVPWKKDTI